MASASNTTTGQGQASIQNQDKDNPLHLSWYDSAWIPVLNPSNVMDYFSERSNPFYDRTCNNEVVKMQRLNPEQLNQMTGIEYILLHVQEPILYVIRKQLRHSPQNVTPLANYYIIAGIVHQAPDLCSVLNARMLTATHNIQSSFNEARSYSRYYPSKGYWWEFKESEQADKAKKKNKTKEEPSSFFQRQRVDVLLGELAKKYPPKVVQMKPGEKPVSLENKESTEQIAEAVREEKNGESQSSQSNTSTSIRSSLSIPRSAFPSSMQPPGKKRKLK
ncbi:mediator of RNA polymerase II transcription subunit 6-like isoform X2 [Saccoglossus kowalevskii]|uniref:Mediator of RNA polymerase II transcription subunit 6 n=1 Tax=Saccoglossus kowalevskii TaxID=10224 RepID=A0ABM0GJL9_SACKO|nr:PREDICTED: mediator of RNA polymerase II transcription subunit 6-like [Saccoglossus kowalevskii]